ncbi:three-helix bundle dimerization domain-containing protein [Streptomyces telluris]|uniref:Arsenate reductase ArsC n=2 Tax=Streptomyces telluris TaxID=2720021 RepID=A0A9X2LHP8_9ACTN|nr:arsenate reductase ArsC [Streptomyces telluris]MCQ8771393.1 arsenate reductase ArsC [Streptomyces telluris]NJP82928.1 arsenate reductase ArsC [Streptomyces telluris]
MTASASPLPVLPDERLAAGAARLTTRHTGRFGPETVQRLLVDSYACLAAVARVRTHLVVLAERLTAERLDVLAHSESAVGERPVRVLFVCSRGAGRSQSAAALLARRADERMAVSCAGTTPAAEVEPGVVVSWQKRERDEIGTHITGLPDTLPASP